MKKRFVFKKEILFCLLVLMGASLACNYQNQDAVKLIAEAAFEKCFDVDRASYESALEIIGEAPETPAYPETASYQVCYSRMNRHPRSAQMFGGDKPPGDLVSDDNKDIPVGTYISEVYANNEPPPGGDDWEYELESEFTITVAEDGTVTGFKTYRYWVVDENEGCTTHTETGIFTSVSGFLDGNQGTATLEDHALSFHEYHGEACGDGKDILRDEENVFEATITVSGDQMDIITSKGQVIYTLIKE